MFFGTPFLGSPGIIFSASLFSAPLDPGFAISNISLSSPGSAPLSLRFFLSAPLVRLPSFGLPFFGSPGSKIIFSASFFRHPWIQDLQHPIFLWAPLDRLPSPSDYFSRHPWFGTPLLGTPFSAPLDPGSLFPNSVCRPIITLVGFH